MSHKKRHSYSNRWQDKPWANRQLQRAVQAELAFDIINSRERARREKARLAARRRRTRRKAQALEMQKGPGAEGQRPGP